MVRPDSNEAIKNIGILALSDPVENLNVTWQEFQPMTFPTRQSNTGGAAASSSISHVVNMPAGVTSGDLLVIIFGTRASRTITEPSGWTKLSQSAGSNTSLAVIYKKSDGTEGADETVTLSANAWAAWETYRITGAVDPASQAPEAAYAFADVDESSGDPPSLTPTGGAKDYLWLTVAFKRDDDEVTTFPANYVNTGFERTASTPAALGFAERTVNASSEDPGVFSWAQAADWTAVTIAIHPAAGGANPKGPLGMVLNGPFGGPM